MEPNSPEAKRAAQKVHNGFLFLAALNLIFFAIVLWPRGKKNPTPPEKNPPGATASPKRD